MKAPVLLFFLSLLLASGLKAQHDSLRFEGKYYQTNLYIYNPSVADSFSVYMIVVNGDSIVDELNSNAVEVDFQLEGLKPEQEVEVLIYFDSLFPPLVVNPEALYSPQRFKFSRPRIKKDIISWRVYGDVSDYPIEIQQFRWNAWRTIKEIDPLDTVANNYYADTIYPHSGQNTFRLKTTNINGMTVYSKEVRYRPPFVDEIFIMDYKVSNELEFTGETYYEIYDSEGVLVQKGRDRYVNVSALKPDEYWVNYDNKTEKFKIKKR